MSMKLNHLQGGKLGDKISLADYFYVQFKTLVYLFRIAPSKTLILTTSLVIRSFYEFVSLKYLKYLTNAAAILFTGESDSPDIVIRNALLFIVCISLFVINEAFINRFQIHYTENIYFAVKKQINSKLINVQYEYFESSFYAGQLARIKSINQRLSGSIWGIIHFLKVIGMLVVYSILLYDIGLVFSLTFIVCTVISLFISLKVSSYQNQIYQEKVEPSSRRRGYFQYIFGNIQNHKTIKNGRLYKFFISKYLHWNKENRTAYFKMNNSKVRLELVTLLLQLLFSGIALYYTIERIVSGNLQIGDFTITATLLFNCFDTMRSYCSFISSSSFFIRVMSSFFSFLELPDYHSFEAIERHGTAEPLLSLQNINYKYPQSNNFALKNLSLNIDKGQKVCIVGENGCGKTTLTGVIMGLLTSYDGKYSISRALGEKSIDVYMSGLFQDFGEYQMTVRENIELGNGGQHISDEKIFELLKRVGLFEEVQNMSHGVDTQIGQLNNGTGLSKGQWQKLAVCRLLADEEATIWILDEPTAYLDPISEIEFYTLINNFAGDKTVLFISHRLGWAKNADLILVMKDGTIAESGTHQQLLEKEGDYYTMYCAQKKIYE